MSKTDPMTPRVAWIAAALSLLACGVGHIYCGKVVRGFFLFCAWMAVPVLGLALALIDPSAVALFAFMFVPVFGLLVVYLLAAVDAYRLASRAGADYERKDYNHAGLYVLLILVGMIYPIGVVTLYREVLFEAFVIPTRSMAPTIAAGDRVLANKLSPRNQSPKRGDLVVFVPRNVPGRRWVKRVVGLAGDKVEVRGDEVLVNGKSLRIEGGPGGDGEDGSKSFMEQAGEKVYETYQRSEPPNDDKGVVQHVVPDGSLFVLGDNRARSRDSRHIGFIHVDDVLGLVQYRYYPKVGVTSRYALDSELAGR